jgi:hypothetical protein
MAKVNLALDFNQKYIYFRLAFVCIKIFCKFYNCVKRIPSDKNFLVFKDEKCTSYLFKK